MDHQVAKNTKVNTLNKKVNKLDRKSSDATTLIHINLYKTDEQNLKKKIGDVEKENTRR